MRKIPGNVGARGLTVTSRDFALYEFCRNLQCGSSVSLIIPGSRTIFTRTIFSWLIRIFSLMLDERAGVSLAFGGAAGRVVSSSAGRSPQGLRPLPAVARWL